MIQRLLYHNQRIWSLLCGPIRQYVFFLVLCHKTAVLLVNHVHNLYNAQNCLVAWPDILRLKIYQHVLPFYLNKFNLPTNHTEYMHTMWQEYWRLMYFCLNTWTSSLHTKTHTHKFVLIVWLPLNYLCVLQFSLKSYRIPSYTFLDRKYVAFCNIRKVDMVV